MYQSVLHLKRSHTALPKTVRTYSLFLLFIFFLSSFGLLAQTKSEQDLIKQGNKFFYEENYTSATPLFLQLLSLNQTSAEYNYKYGTCVLHSDGDKAKALKYLLYAATKSNDLDKEAYYFTAKALHLNYRFAEAIKYYQKYAGIASDKNKEKFQVSRQIEMCNSGKRLLRNVTDLIVVSKKDYREADFFRLYNPNDVEGKILVAEDLQSSADKKKDHRVVINLPKSSDIVYYSSYGEEGKSKDIYRVKRLPGGGWSKSQAIKGAVNTPYDEDYPFMHPDGRSFYFCSKGHNSMGGYDVFKSTYDPETETFSAPENLDFAINTPDDDILYILDSLENSAWFASKRESGVGKVHVYNVRVERLPVLIAIVKGKFVNEVQPGKNSVTITIENTLTGEVEGVFNAKAGTGDYLITLDKSGKYKYKVKAETNPETFEAIVDIPYQKELRPLKQEIALVKKEGKEEIVIRNMFDQTIEDADDIIAEVLKNKASLDPNADNIPDSLLNAIKKQKKDSVVDAAINENLTNDDLIKLAKDQAEKQEAEAKELKAQLEAAYAVAAQKIEEAKTKAKDAENNIAQGDEIIDPLEKGMLYDEARKQNEEADKAAKEAVIALNLAKSLEQQTVKAEQDAKVARQYADGIESAINSKNKDEAIKKLKEQQNYIKSLMTGESAKDDLYAETKKKAAEKRDEANKALTNANNLKALETDIQSEIAALKREEEKAKGKKKEEIQEKIKSLENDLASTTDKKKDAFRKAENLTKEADQIDSQAEMLAGILDNPTANSGKTLSQDEKNQLANNIKNQTASIEDNTQRIDKKTQVDRNKKFDYNDFLAKYDYYANMFNEYERLKRSLLTPDDYDKLISHNSKWINEIDEDLANIERDEAKADENQKKLLAAKKEQLKQLKAIKEQENNDLKVERQKLLDRLANKTKSTEDIAKLNDKEVNANVKKNEDAIKAIENSTKSDERKAIEKNKANEAFITEINKNIDKERKNLPVLEGEEKVKALEKIKILEEVKTVKENEIKQNNTLLENNGVNTEFTNTVTDKVNDNASLENNNNVKKQVDKTEKIKSDINELQIKKNETNDPTEKTAIDNQIKSKSIDLYKEEEKLADVVKNENNKTYDTQKKEIENKLNTTLLTEENKINTQNLFNEAEKDKSEADKLFELAKNESDPVKKNNLLENAIQKQNEAIQKQNDASAILQTNKSSTTVANTPTNTDPKVLSNELLANYNSKQTDIKNSSKTENEKNEELKELNNELIQNINAEIEKLKGLDVSNMTEEEKRKHTLRLEELNRLLDAKKKENLDLDQALANNTSSTNPANITNSPTTLSQDQQTLANEVSNDFVNKENTIKNSNKSDTEKAIELKTLNENLVKNIESEIVKLQTNEGNLSEEEKRKRRLKIEELNRLLDAKKAELGLIDQKLVEAKIIDNNTSNQNITNYTQNPNNYHDANAQKEFNAIKEKIASIEQKQSELNNLKAKEVATTDQAEKDKLQKEIAKKEKELVKNEIALAQNIEKINNAEIKNNQATIQSILSKINSEDLNDEQRQRYNDAKTLIDEANNNLTKAIDLRKQAKAETNEVTKNNLLKQANKFELEAIKKQNQAEEILEVLLDEYTVLVKNNTTITTPSNLSETEKQTLNEVSPGYENKLNEIINSNESELRKTYAQNELNKEAVSKLENEINKLQSNESGLTEEEKRKRKMRLEELNRLLDAKKAELGITEDKLKQAGIIADQNQNNNFDYNATLSIQNPTALTEKQKIDKQLAEIDKDQEALAQLRIKIAETNDPVEKDKLEKQAKTLTDNIIKKEIAIGPSIEKINTLEYNSHLNTLSSKQLNLTENGTQLNESDKNAVNNLINEAETLYKEAKTLRDQAKTEKDNTRKNDLLKQAHQKETTAINKLVKAEQIINNASLEQTTANTNGNQNSELIASIDKDYANNVKDIETSSESPIRKTLKKQELNEKLIQSIKNEIQSLENGLSEQTPEEKERRRLKIQELNTLLDQKQKELDAQNQYLAANNINNTENRKVSYNDPYPINNASSKSLLIEAKQRIDDLKREEAKLNDLQIKRAEATTEADKKKLDTEIKNQEKAVIEKELLVAKVYGDINQKEIKDNKTDLDKLQSKAIDNAGIDKNSTEYNKAQNLLTQANSNISQANQLRKQAETETNKDKKNNLLKQAFAFEKDAINKQLEAKGLLEKLLSETDGSIANNNTPKNRVPENSNERASYKELQKYEELTRQADYLAQRASTVRDSAETVKKKNRPDVIAKADKLQNESDALRTEANLAKNNYEKLKLQEDEQLAIQEKQRQEAELAKQMAPEVAKMNEYAKYYQLQKEVNELNDQIKRNEELEREARNKGETEKADSLKNATTLLKSQAEQKQTIANNYLTSIDREKADKITKVVGENRNNLVQPEVAYIEPVVNINNPVEFAKNFKAPEEIKTDIFAKSDSPAYNANNPIPVNPESPKGVYYAVQIGAFRNPIQQEEFKEFVPIHGETTPTGLTRYTVGYFKQYNSANGAKNEIRTFGGGTKYADAFVVAFKDGQRISMAEAQRLLNNPDALVNNNPTNNNPTNNNPNNNDPSNNPNNTNPNNTTTNTIPNNNNPANNTIDLNNAGKEFNNFVVDNAKADYYKQVPNAAKANQVETIKGLFYTVQVGVYSKPVSLDKIYNIQPLNSERTATGKIRYTTGVYKEFTAADNRKTQARNAGIKDAFVTAYFNGKKITVDQARALVQQYGETIYANPENVLQNNNQVTPVNNNQNNNPNNNNPVNTNQNNTENNNPTNNPANNNPANNNPSNNNPENNTAIYTVILGEYTGEVPAKDAEIFLNNNGSYKILKGNRNNKSVYFIETNKGKAEADKISSDFKSKGLTNSKVEPGKIQTQAGNNGSNTVNNVVEPKQVNDLRFQVYLGEYLDEIPEDDAMIYINNVSKGVKRKTINGYTIYYTCDCPSYDQALELKAHFVHEGITSIRIVPFLNEKEITVGEAFKLIYE